MKDTWREIFEQPKVMKWSLDIPDSILNNACNLINQAENIYISGSGSAFHAGLFGNYLFNEINNIDKCQSVLAGEFIYQGENLSGDDLIIAVSQSGESRDILEVAEISKHKGAKILAITNTHGSDLAKMADEVIYTPAGVEKGVMATKTFTAQLAVFILISNALDDNLEAGKMVVNNISESQVKLLDDENLHVFESLANLLKDEEDVYVLGSNIDYPVALESALKIKEASHIHAEAFSANEFEHGPITLVGNKSYVIAFISGDGSEEDSLANLLEVDKLDARIIGISSKKFRIFEKFLRVDDFGIYTPLVSIVCAQLLAYFLAEAKGLNPDKPRNLKKIVD